MSGLKLGGRLPKLSKEQAEVLKLLTEDFLTVRQIAIRREKSLASVYKIKKKLEKKGLLSKGLKGVEKKGGTFKPLRDGVRVHGQQFRVGLLSIGERYRSRFRVGGRLEVWGNVVFLYRDCLVVYSNQSFFGEDLASAFGEGVSYWTRFFRLLENDLGVVLLQSRRNNIVQVKGEYALVRNGLARQVYDRGEKVKVRTRDDGKVWFLIDNSFNLHEAETVHSESGFVDMQEVVEPFFNDLRENRPPTLSEIMKVIGELVEVNKETASGLNAVVGVLKKDLGSGGVVSDDKPVYMG